VLRGPSPLNPGQKKSSIEVETQTADQQTYVLCRSEQRIATVFSSVHLSLHH
jgi:hypothetical protein